MKEEILQTSLEQFLKYGIRKMSIQKLAEPMGISSKTVYKYFGSKEDLVREALLCYYQQKYQIFENKADSQKTVGFLCAVWHGSIEAELKVNQKFFRDLLYYYPDLSKKFTVIEENKFVNPFLRIINRGITEGVFRQGIQPEITLEGMFVLYTAIVRNEHFRRLHLASPELLFNTIIVYIKGFCTRNGIAEVDEYLHSLQPFDGVNKRFGLAMQSC